jgi:hypothetical protein
LFSFVDELKQKSRPASGNKKAQNAKPKVVKSSAARAVGGKLKSTAGPRRRKSEGSVPMETSSKTGHPTNVQSGRVTIKPRVAATKALKVTISNNKANNKVNKSTKSNSNVGTPRNTRQKSTLDTSIATARAIIANAKHPRNKDVRTLLESYQKNFINEGRFTELLKTMLF